MADKPNIPDFPNLPNFGQMITQACEVVASVRGIPYDFNGTLSLENKVVVLFKTVKEMFDAHDVLVKSYKDLYDFINDYFSNLDIQEEVNKKIDKMVVDGTFDRIITKYMTAYLYITDLDNTGRTDVSQIIQNFINNKCGTLKIPCGKYKIEHDINIPEGINIIGDYCDSDDSINGTVFLLYNASITINNGNSLSNITFYHPNIHIINDIPTEEKEDIIIAENSKCILLENLYFVNSYYAINARNAHEKLTVNNIKGYVINTGISIDNSSDVDRISNVLFNYNTIASHPLVVNANAFGAYTRKNGVMIKIERADWCIIDNVFCWGYSSGITLSGTEEKTSGILITNSGFDACGSGIEGGAFDLTVSNCKFTSFNLFDATVNNKIALNITSGRNCLINNCQFWHTHDSPISVTCRSSALSNISIKDTCYSNTNLFSINVSGRSTISNILFNTKSHGIKASNVTDLFISGCTVNDLNTIFFNSNSTINNCTIIANTTKAIQLPDNINNIIINNYLKSSQVNFLERPSESTYQPLSLYYRDKHLFFRDAENKEHILV